MTFIRSDQLLSHVWLFATPWTAAHQVSLSPTPRAYSNSCPSHRWCHPAISSSVVPFSHLQSFPASGSFPVSQFFASDDQSIGASASASVLPMNRMDWLDLLAVQGTLKSLLQHHSSKASILKKKNQKKKSINSSALGFLFGPTLTSILDYWKNHSLDYINLCR